MPHLGRRWLAFIYVFLASLVFCCTLNVLSVKQADLQVAAQSPDQEQLVRTGIERYQVGKSNEAIALWQQALAQITQPKERAVVYNNLAIAYREVGKLDLAIAHWEQAIEIYRSQNDNSSRRQIAGLLTEQGQTYTDLGQHRRAIALLQSAVEITIQIQDELTEVAARGALGNAYQALGDYEQALAFHDRSLKLARKLNNSTYISTALNNEGNVYVSRSERYQYQANLARIEGEDREAARLTQLAERDKTAAQKDFEQSVRESQVVGGMVEVKALLNFNHLLEKAPSPNQSLIASNRNRVSELLEQAANSRDKAYALINLAFPRERGGDKSANSSELLLQKALDVAKSIGDRRAESFALGTLGQMSELAKQYDTAMQLTRQAADAAQQVNAADSLYRWQWQSGRIFKATGLIDQAIASYNQAIASLQTIRSDIVIANKELQFNFRDDVEPVYRELMDLLLTGEQQQVKSYQQPQSALKTVINTLELLKLAELQNFFGDDCVQVALNNNEDAGAGFANSNTAAIYSVILDDRTEIILQRPNGTMTSYRAQKSKALLQQEIDRLRTMLEKRETEEYIPVARGIYDLLIRPMEADLAAAKPRTLVFINDGVLRQIPMAALYDGKEFLIQKYPIATTPSLNLTSSKPLDRKNLTTLSMGLTVERPPFAALTNVGAEIKGVQEIMGGIKLLDSAFTLDNLQAKLQKDNYSVVHMATHGKFGVDAESTYLLGFDKRISIEQIDNLLRSRGSRQPVELLTLSACQTAAGDNRSALGIAGVAVRAGVQSALATLWYINDAATVPLIEEFYRQLRQPNVTKAEALQKAQIKMLADLDYNHPAVWSPFILIGNWL